MPAPLQPFLISEFKTGLYDYLQPWIRPQDAFEPLVNAFIYRGVLQKRNGSTIFGNQLADTSPVMGIMPFINEATGATSLVVCSTKNAYLYAAGSTPDGGTFGALTTIGGANSVFWTGTAVNATGSPAPIALPLTGTAPTFWQNLVASSVVITISTASTGVTVGSVTDNGSGGWTSATGIATTTGTINYTTGKMTVSVTVPGNTTYTLSMSIAATTTGGYFSGTIANFFNSVNWQPTSSITNLSVSYLYMVNNNDPITIFDGTNLARPIFYIDSTNTPYIETALDVKVYNNRLLFLRPTLSSESNAANQDVYYSALFNPFNFVGDMAGNGGAISAATGDQIVASKFIRDNLVIAFSGSFWSFQNSGVTSPPFLFRRLNSSKNNACPYGMVQYDERVTSLGNTGFTACDGVNVQRFDLPIIDYYETQIAQEYFNQDFAIRYDNENQTWMLYPSSESPNAQNPLIGSVAPGSDQTLVYNFLENTWATFDNSFNMTCLGKFLVPVGTTWANALTEWQNTDVPWNYGPLQPTTPFLLGGDVNGNVYHLDNELAVRDGMSISGGQLQGGTSFQVNILTTRWNPFLSLGQRTQFAYIDVYYQIVSSITNPIQVTFKFFVDNSSDPSNPTASQVLTFDGPTGSDYAFKRVYCNLIGEFIRIGIDPSEDAPFQIVGFVLWARPAGRMTP